MRSQSQMKAGAHCCYFKLYGMFAYVLSGLDLILIMEVVKRIIAFIVPPHNKATETRLWNLHSAKTAQ